MNNYREKYLETLTDTVCKIMGKPELSQQDIQLIMLYKSELRRVEYIPKLKRIMNGAKEVLGFIKQLNGADESDTETETKQIAEAETITSEVVSKDEL